MFAITVATGQLGHYVIESLMKTVPASQIVTIIRNPAKAQALAAQEITLFQLLRQANLTHSILTFLCVLTKSKFRC